MAKEKEEKQVDFFRDLVKEMKDEDMSLAVDGLGSAEFTGWVDTGAYALNALTSGSIYGGMPNNKRTMFAGVSTTGKTFFALSIIKSFLIENPKAGVIYYDSESAVTKDMLTERGIDAARVIIVDVDTIQRFNTKVLNFVKAYTAQPEKTRPPMMLVLDSLGNLTTSKSLEDQARGADTRDMTRAGLIRGAFRSITVPLAKAKVPLVITNHTYQGFGGLYPTEELSGGGGARFAADNIIFLSKAQDKDSQTGPVLGNIITARNFKSRFTKERAIVKLRLRYDSGLDKYYGLLDIAERGGLVTQVAKKFTLPDGTEAKESMIYKHPERFFTKEFLDQIDVVAGKLFKYGGALESKAEALIDNDISEPELLLEGDE